MFCNFKKRKIYDHQIKFQERKGEVPEREVFIRNETGPKGKFNLFANLK